MAPSTLSSVSMAIRYHVKYQVKLRLTTTSRGRTARISTGLLIWQNCLIY